MVEMQSAAKMLRCTVGRSENTQTEPRAHKHELDTMQRRCIAGTLCYSTWSAGIVSVAYSIYTNIA